MNGTTSSHLDLHERVPWQSGPQTRGAFGIIWSCLAVIITCTWTVLHLNIPSTTGRKVKWMFVTFLFPEYIFAHAVVELKMALDDYIRMGKQRKEYLKIGWSVTPGKWAIKTHGLLTNFRTLKEDMTSSKLDNFLKSEEDRIIETAPLGNIELSRPSSTHNNPDMPAAASPSVRHYPTDKQITTESSVWTLTHSYFANMGGVIAEKRGSAGGRFIMLGDTLASPNRRATYETMSKLHLSEDDIRDRSKVDVFVRVLWIWQMVRLLIELSIRATRSLPVTQLEIIATSFAVLTFITVLVQVHKPQSICQPCRVEIENPPISFEFVNVHSLFEQFVMKPSYRTRLPHSRLTRVMNDSSREGESVEQLFSIMLMVSTTIFGLIHVAAWAFQFPTSVEAWIWRICSLASTILPLLIVLVTYLFHGRLTGAQAQWADADRNVAYQTSRLGSLRTPAQKLKDNLHKAGVEYEKAFKSHARWEFAHRSLQFGSILLYLSTRIIIITLAFISFRSAPRGIYQDTWAGFLPTIQ